MQDALADLRGTVSDVLGVIVASVDGLPMAHDVRTGDPASIAAMAATAAGLGKRIVDDFDIGGFAECVVRAEGGYFVVYSAGRVAVLAVMASEGANLGRVHLAARHCAAKVADAVEEGLT
ncbi:MAG: roadblock/LC7 domain-containing protein [Solirubrobacterales bacterium]|nr:roadblock/LC7 domain-containing protein [Solirubrobacterales bacterium]